MHTPNIHTIMISKGYNSILLHLLIGWLAAMPFRVRGTRCCDFFVACLHIRLANGIVKPTVRHLLIACELNALLLGCVKGQGADLAASAEVSASRIESAELVCVTKSLCVEFRIIMLLFIHSHN